MCFPEISALALGWLGLGFCKCTTWTTSKALFKDVSSATEPNATYRPSISPVLTRQAVVSSFHRFKAESLRKQNLVLCQTLHSQEMSEPGSQPMHIAPTTRSLPCLQNWPQVQQRYGGARHLASWSPGLLGVRPICRCGGKACPFSFVSSTLALALRLFPGD